MQQKNRNWIWVFAVLFVLGSAAIVMNYWYNMRQQLKPADLQAAIALWKAKGPTDYDLLVRREISPASGGDPVRDEYRVQIRGGKATQATLNNRDLEARLWPDYEIPAWFDYLQRFMEIDTKPKAPTVFCRAEFDPKDGHPLRYVRRVMGTRERVELMFDLKPIR